VAPVPSRWAGDDRLLFEVVKGGFAIQKMVKGSNDPTTLPNPVTNSTVVESLRFAVNLDQDHWIAHSSIVSHRLAVTVAV
jgi:hypothetical protein